MPDVIDVAAPKLQAFACRLEKLMQSAQKDEVRDPLDYLLGALHALFQAKRLGFKDRHHPLHDADGHSPEGRPYWEYGPLTRVQLMKQGQIRVDGAWTAGFYFNSALARMAGAFDRTVRFHAARKGVDRPQPGSTRPPSVREMLRALGLPQFTSGKLAAVYDEVNPLKHRPAGLARRRKVTMAGAIVAFDQILDLLEHPTLQ